MRGIITYFLISLLFPGCCGFSYAQQEVSQAVSKDEQDPYSWDFGKVSEGEVLQHTYVLKNDSPVTLQIIRIQTTCGCTISKAPEKKVIPPGESVDIQVSFNTRGYSGIVEQVVYVHTDRQDSPIIKFTLKADVYPTPSTLSSAGSKTR
jgi:hypothetical protein